MDSKIDFVIAWVDGSDPIWQSDKEKYTGIKAEVDACRYRDWDLLRYWFRGVEKFAPWVNKIHFVTYGHLPVWLNTSHPKLNIVKHKDYIPKEYLPTFNSHTIELNFHRIKGLTEQFVYFNDDMFLTDFVNEKDFFANGCVRDTLALEPLRFDSRSIAYIDCNNIALINDKYNKKRFVKENIIELINPTIGINKLIKNLLLIPFPYFTGFFNHHLATSFFKKSYELAWNIFGDELHNTCLCKTRERNNVNQWLIKDLQIVNNKIKNRDKNFGRRFNIRHGNYKACSDVIRKQKYKIVCINDNENISNLEVLISTIKESFDLILPHKSSFEVK